MKKSHQTLNKEIVLNLLKEVDRGNLDIIDEVYDDAYVDHTPSPIRNIVSGKAGMKRAAEIFYKAFPETEHRIINAVAEDDLVAVNMVAKAVHKGELFDIEPTQKEVSLAGIGIYRLKGGRIVERWAYNTGDVLNQLEISIPIS